MGAEDEFRAFLFDRRSAEGVLFPVFVL